MYFVSLHRCFLCTVPTHQEAAAAKSKPGYVIPDTMVQELVGAELYAKVCAQCECMRVRPLWVCHNLCFCQYVRFVAKNYAETNPSIKWCPEPDCQCVVDGANSGYICNIANDYGPTVACESGHRFCFNCNYKAHAPATCQMVQARWPCLRCDVYIVAFRDALMNLLAKGERVGEAKC